MQTDILILGANGQLGFDVVKICKENNLSFIGLTRNEFNALTDDTSMLARYKARYIINCIATTNVDGCENESLLAFNLNSNFVYLLAKFCHSNGIILFHISTDYVFDGNHTISYSEEDKTNPLNIYGLSKLSGELALQNYHDKYFIFRVSALFGTAKASGKSGSNFITSMQNLGHKLDKISVIADQITCPTATIAVAKCINYFIINNIQEYGFYNCVSSNSCSWFEFAKKIFELSRLDTSKLQPIEFANYAFKARRPRYSVMSTQKLSRYYTMPTWEESLTLYFKL